MDIKRTLLRRIQLVELSGYREKFLPTKKGEKECQAPSQTAGRQASRQLKYAKAQAMSKHYLATVTRSRHACINNM